MVNGKMPIAMNKHISLLLTVIWFVACHPNHDLGTPFQEGQEVILTASIGEQQQQMLPGMQRVSGKDATDQIDLTWDEGDNILVTVGDKSSVFTLTTGAGTPVPMTSTPRSSQSRRPRLRRPRRRDDRQINLDRGEEAA